ncbi:MAG: DUF475 domain-containing protein [Vicinamibacterales bacterium]
MRQLLGFFKWSLLWTAAAVAGAAAYGGLRAVGTVVLLIALEASVSFDNALVNAGVLRTLGRAWQRAFLTIGILLAVAGMRVVFPIGLVAVATDRAFDDVFRQALYQHGRFAADVEAASPIIGGFGGAFLMMLALSFFCDPERREHWVRWIEAAMSRAGRVRAVPAVTALAALVAASRLLADDARESMLVAGLAGIATFLAIRGVRALGARAEPDDDAPRSGLAGLAAFAYLETLDASFSLDGVLGAFAISADLVLIAIGLGVGGLYVRSLTVYLVRHRAIRTLPYLTHGAQWAVLVLAVVLLAGTTVRIPEWVPGVVSVSIIGASLVSSLRTRRSGSTAQV